MTLDRKINEALGHKYIPVRVLKGEQSEEHYRHHFDEIGVTFINKLMDEVSFGEILESKEWRLFDIL